MNTLKKVKYFTGTTSASYDAEVRLDDFGIKIFYILDGREEVISWKRDQIEKPNLSGGEKLTIRYGDSFPYQSIEIPNKELASLILKKYDLDTKSKKYSLFTESGVKGIVYGVGIFIAVFALFYLLIIPKIAELAANTVPISVEKQIGDVAKNSLMVGLEVDSLKTKALNSFFKKLNFKTEYNIDLTVVNAPIENAYATSGGNIVVYSKIIDDMECPEQLAGLLGHELTHVNNRHSTKMIFKSLANYIVLSILLSDVNGITATIIDNANAIHQLQFSRDLETEADETSVKLLLDSNIDPNGMVDLLEQLNTLSVSGEEDIPNFIRTHPMTSDRISKAKELINSFKNPIIDTKDWDKEWAILKKPSEYSEIDVFSIFKESKTNEED